MRFGRASWKDGRLALPGGAALETSLSGDASVAWRDGALEIRGAFPASSASSDVDPTIALVVRHPLESPAHVWVPHLTPEPGNVIGDAVFRAPAIVLADRSLALAFIPDLDDVARASGWQAWLDYDHARREITLAAGAYRRDGHVFFVREPPRADGQSVTLRLHVVASRRRRDLDDPWAMAARWLWARWGRPAKLRASPTRLAPLAEHVVRWAFASAWSESVWQPVDLPGASAPAGGPVFIVDVTRHPSVPPSLRRWREPRSIWNQAWFSTQRCANGLLRHARHTASADLEARARAMTELALASPQTDGLFPSRLVAENDAPDAPWRWTSSDRRPASVSEDACHLADAAFTCRMLLEWHALTGDARALAYVERFAARLVRLQHPNGGWAAWIEPDGREARELADGPESAVVAALLFELASRDASARWRDAALATLPLLEDVTRDGRWEDFETYYSCAPWGAPELLGRRVARNGVFKQNTLSIAWCAEAFLLAWRATTRARFLRLARRCASELSLYQAVWDPPFLPAPAHGGFGVMNADSEWNDARQSLFAPLLLELGRETGDRELSERGVAALRASFSMLYCPENAALARAYEARFPFFGPESHGFMMENQGHGADPIGTFTIFTWGNGSAVAAAATVRDRFPEIVLA